MEWTVGGAILPDFVKPDELTQIRHIKVPHVRAQEPAENFNGSWQVCNAQSVRGFTAVGFFFAYRLAQDIDAPIGLIAGPLAVQGVAKVPRLTEIPLQDASWKGGEKGDFAAGRVPAVGPGRTGLRRGSCPSPCGGRT